MNLIKLILVLCVLSLPSFAQEIGGVKGKVRNPRGAILREVTVIARQDDKDVKIATTDKKGEFVIDRLKAGKYSFVFTKDGFTTGTINNVDVGKNKIRDLGSRLVLDVDEGSLIIIRGSVFDQNGRSIYGAKIDIARVSGDGSSKNLGSAYSSQSGEFVFRFSKGVATFRVTATLNGKTDTKDVSVEAAAIYRLALSLNLEKGEDK